MTFQSKVLRVRKMTEFEMKYVGWNIGATRVERCEFKSDIEILGLKIDGVDILQETLKILNSKHSQKSEWK